MAVDFQVVFPQEAVLLNAVRAVNNLGVLTLDVIGEDFQSVDEVLINDHTSPEVVILSRTRLLAQVPDAAKAQRITGVVVLSRKLTLTERSVIKFRVGKTPSKVSGILRLVQLFLKILVTTPGTDIFAQRIGAAALKNVGRTFGRDEGSSIVSDFVVAVSSTSKQIVGIQSRDPSIPRDERLLSAKVLRAAYNRSEEALVVSVELTSQAGRAATANITV
jgi:hypothetical protein